MKYSIDELFEMLSWNSSEEMQQRGIAEAKKIKNISVLIRPIECKSIWENCAQVICSKSDSDLERYLPELFLWLQDMAWPGAETVYMRLIKIPQCTISHAYALSVDTAKKLNDKSWLQVLESFTFQY